jgi:hypothetical protein
MRSSVDSRYLTAKLPLVDKVPGAQGLHLVVGGSYHVFKFLPVFGDIVVDYLQGMRRRVSKDGVGTDLGNGYLSVVRYCRKVHFIRALGNQARQITNSLLKISTVPFHHLGSPSCTSRFSHS